MAEFPSASYRWAIDLIINFLPPLPNILNKLNTPIMDTEPLECETEFMGWKVLQELSNNPPSDILSASRESF